MRKNLKKVVILLLCIMTLLSSSTADVFASTRGGRGTQTMVIQTKSNYWYPGSSSITLKQSKQTLTQQKLWGNKKKTQRGYYGYYLKDMSAPSWWLSSISKGFRISLTLIKIPGRFNVSPGLHNLSGYFDTFCRTPYRVIFHSGDCLVSAYFYGICGTFFQIFKHGT